MVEVYKYALMLDPQSTGALVNLGTIHFNARDMKMAEDYYKRAIEADGEYALAHFNLGNLYDETGQRAKALEQYSGSGAHQPALRPMPTTTWRCCSRPPATPSRPSATGRPT